LDNGVRAFAKRLCRHGRAGARPARLDRIDAGRRKSARRQGIRPGVGEPDIMGVAEPHFVHAPVKSQPVQWYTLRPLFIFPLSVYSTVNKHFLIHLIRHSPNAGVVEAEIAALNGHSRRWLPWQCSRHPFESFGNGGAALPATSLCECMYFTVLGACLRLKENKVILPAHSRAAAP
jgi:hypothetical protein